ncbi:hypothetical protein BASA50_009668 [Batrachochytrium salamandrivorans]|uniref:Phosphoribulokinase/uridine kinase domain-containing protein n=1 Tax=Batrachochytrium salamandrivorans TaxID=1357716 RepID=A0ABQ8F0J0_9FUNG|nr:hypothetical protein BASA60_009030 [Batrachochytrium salamandrivorans]KAH6589966.1 hypothetical protein BASA50_009668 [Batrachochytrium salamandrivorans]KAH9270252.1 hypothetical protein BASA83_007590 [Batrachochytrium salamandrivorans]
MDVLATAITEAFTKAGTDATGSFRSQTNEELLDSSSLRSDTVERSQTTLPGRILVALCGIPGAGKTTAAHRLAQIAVSANIKAEQVIVVPMDGFHLTRAQLDLLPDPIEAHRRRGAPFTFDAAGLLDLVRSVCAQTVESVWAPSFDHSVGDPIPASIEIKPSHRIIIFEGLYLQLNIPVWSDIYAMFDLTCFIDIPLDVAVKRVAARHVACGLVSTLEEGMQRATMNDLANAEFILSHSLRPQCTVSYLDLLDTPATMML